KSSSKSNPSISIFFIYLIIFHPSISALRPHTAIGSFDRDEAIRFTNSLYDRIKSSWLHLTMLSSNPVFVLFPGTCHPDHELIQVTSAISSNAGSSRLPFFLFLLYSYRGFYRI